MKIQEPGILETSLRYFFTPSSFAEQILFYATRIGKYDCNCHYYFSGQSEVGQNPSHHLHYMLILVTEGTMHLSLEKRSYTAHSGDLVFFDCKRAHEYTAASDQLSFYWLVFDGIGFADFFDKILELHAERHVFPTSDQTKVQTIMERFIECAAGSLRLSETKRSELIYSLLCCLFLNQHKADSPLSHLIEEAMHFMDRNFMKTLHVSDIASYVGLSASHLTRCFREQVGYSPYEYLMLRRIGEAKNLLLQTRYTIHRIAFECGYKSDENFIRSFKKAVGTSPKAFREAPV